MPTRPQVLVAISMHPQARARLQAVADVQSWPADLRGLREVIGGYDGLIVYSARFDREVFSEAYRLKVMSCHSFAEELLAAATQRGIRVTRVPSLWDTVADMALALIFSAARGIPQAMRPSRPGCGHAATSRWASQDTMSSARPWDRRPGEDRHGPGQESPGVRDAAPVLRSRPQAGAGARAARRVPDPGAAPGGSGYRLHPAPLREETRGLIGEREFRMMKPDAILVNTARGAILDERASAGLYRSGGSLRRGWMSMSRSRSARIARC